MSNKFKGVGVAMVTPFDSAGKVDYDGLEKLTNHLIDNGIDYLVVQGTTGESATLSKEEKKAVLEFIIDVNKQRLPIVFGLGGNNTQEVINGFSQYDFSGIDAILSVSPYYNKPTQAGIIEHFKAIGEASPVPIIAYNVPGRTSSNMTAATTLSLAKEVPLIFATKEASGDLDQIGEIIKDQEPDFLVISGDDGLIVPHLALGGHGIISVIGNAFPRAFSSIVHAGLDGNFEDARNNFYQLKEIIELLFVEGNPGGVKAALKILGICGDEVRLPLVKISSGTYGRVEKAIENLRLPK